MMELIRPIALYIGIFWAVVVGVFLLIIAWKQALVIFGIPLGLGFLFVLFFAEWTFEGGREMQRVLMSIILIPLICFGIYHWILDLYKSSKERLQKRRAKKLENL